MTMSRRLLLSGPAVLVAACAPVDLGPLEDLQVEAAWIQEVQVRDMVVLGGTARGDGVLHVVGEGMELAAPVELDGGVVGFGVDMANVAPIGTFLLELPDAQVRGEELLGRYRGSLSSMVLLAGVEVRHLHNGRGVGLDQPFLGYGLGMVVGFTWLDLELQDTPTGALDTGDWE